MSSSVFLTRFLGSLLFTSQFGNHVILMFNFFFAGSDLVIFVSSVRFSGTETALQSFDFFSQSSFLCVYFGLSLANQVLFFFFSLDSSVDFIDLLLYISGHCFNANGFVNDFLDSLSAALKSKNKLVLLSKEGVVNGCYLFSVFQCLANMGFGNGDLLFVFRFVLSKLGTFEVRLDGQPQLPPKPSFTDTEVANGALQEARHPVSLSRKCKIKNWPCTACNAPFATSVSVKLGFGGNCGWPSSLTSNVPSLHNTKQNTKRRSPLPRPILARHWKIEKR